VLQKYLMALFGEKNTTNSSRFFVGILGSSLNKIKDNEISNYLKEFNYSIYAKSVNTVTFIENNFLEEREK
jgi:hypothetical protein